MQTPSLERESTDLDKRPVEDVVPTVVEKKRLMNRLGLARSRPRCQGDGVNNVQEPKRQRRKLSQMIKSAIAKTRKVSQILAREACLL